MLPSSGRAPRHRDQVQAGGLPPTALRRRIARRVAGTRGRLHLLSRNRPQNRPRPRPRPRARRATPTTTPSPASSRVRDIRGRRVRPRRDGETSLLSEPSPSGPHFVPAHTLTRSHAARYPVAAWKINASKQLELSATVPPGSESASASASASSSNWGPGVDGHASSDAGSGFKATATEPLTWAAVRERLDPDKEIVYHTPAPIATPEWWTVKRAGVASGSATATATPSIYTFKLGDKPVRPVDEDKMRLVPSPPPEVTGFLGAVARGVDSIVRGAPPGGAGGWE